MHIEDIIAQFSLTSHEVENIDNLVYVGKFKNRNDAIRWLVSEGIKANHDYLKKVSDVKKQIDQMKKQIIA